jgi:hypothetical protein
VVVFRAAHAVVKACAAAGGAAPRRPQRVLQRIWVLRPQQGANSRVRQLLQLRKAPHPLAGAKLLIEGCVRVRREGLHTHWTEAHTHTSACQLTPELGRNHNSLKPVAHVLVLTPSSRTEVRSLVVWRFWFLRAIGALCYILHTLYNLKSWYVCSSDDRVSHCTRGMLMQYLRYRQLTV